MQGDGLFASIPIWVIFVATLLLVLLSVEGGYRWARYKHRSEVEREAPVGAMVGATLGLLAFVLAFTFSMAADRFHDRKIALLDEANAIGTTYSLADVIPEPHRTEVRKVLRDYVVERLQWTGVEKVQGGLSANALLDQLWAQAAAVGAQNPGGVVVFLSSVNKVIELRVERVMLRERSHIPGAFWAVLYLITILAHAAMGHHGGVAGTNRSPVMVAVAISFAAVIMLIADIDSPGRGFINVSQQPMIDLHDRMTVSKP